MTITHSYCHAGALSVMEVTEGCVKRARAGIFLTCGCGHLKKNPAQAELERGTLESIGRREAGPPATLEIQDGRENWATAPDWFDGEFPTVTKR